MGSSNIIRLLCGCPKLGAGVGAQVLNILEEDDCLGNEVRLVCQNHPNTITPISTAADFDLLACEGGCSRQCDQRLPCGHACQR